MRQLLRKEVNAAMKHPMKLPPFPDSFSKQKIHIHTLTTLINFLDNKNLFRNKPKSTIDRTQTAKAVRQALKCVAGEFDIILVDEGQDLDEAQYDLLLHLCKADKLTGGKSVFIFYDDLQNIFGMEGSVTSRLSAETIEHFLPQCVRTSKKIMDFVFNTCISSSIQLEDRHRIEEHLRLPFLKDQGYISEVKLSESQIWIDCNFCVFPGEIEPQIERFLSRANCFESLQKELITLFSDQDLRDKLKDGILIICFKNDFAEALYKHLSSSLGEDVQLRSGSSIKAREKLSALAVEPACVNIVNIWDAKGYDADIVYILNPDDGGGSSYEHRMRFYVSATRAKQFLGVYTTKPPEDTPIFNDAAKAIEVLNDWPKLVETSPRP
jgi:superfamily I DNA and RNA helicase